MDIVRVDNKGPARGFCAELGHAVKVDEKGKEDLICGRTVFKDAKKVGFEADGGDISGVEGQRRGGGRNGGSGGSSEGAPDGGILVDGREGGTGGCGRRMV
jgi:hypothetical protein